MESKGPGSRAAGPFGMCNVPGAIAINIITVPLETPEGDDVASAAGIDCARKGVKRRIFRWCARSVIANRGDAKTTALFCRPRSGPRLRDGLSVTLYAWWRSRPFFPKVAEQHVANSDTEVVIVGGGAAGVAACRRLKDAGIGCLLIEA